MRLEKYKHPQADRLSCLLTAVQKRASANEKKNQASEVSHLSNDLFFKILLLLPAESLHRSSFVCKAWFSLISSSNFVEAQICKSETVLIFLKSVSQTRPKTFSIESKLCLPESSSIFSTSGPHLRYLSFVEMQDGKGKVIESNISGFNQILATCNGLVLVTRETRRGLIVFNPASRKLLALPLGTTLPLDETYGFVFSHSSREYKVVHLFRDASRHIGCEILSLTMRSWRAVDGPSIGQFRTFLRKPVAANGSLHWLPARDGCSYLVSMGIDDEKFHTRNLPSISRINDRLLEIGGFISFVTHVEPNRIEVWILKGLEGEDWVKRHTITSFGMRHLVPTCMLRCGRELVFYAERNQYFYTCDMEIQRLREVVMEGGVHLQRGSYLPHVNTLASWGSLGPVW